MRDFLGIPIFFDDDDIPNLDSRARYAHLSPNGTGGVGAHAATHNAGGSDAMAIDTAAATGGLRTLGGGATQALPGNTAIPPAAPHLESKQTPGAAASESVTWSSAFGVAPTAVVSMIATALNPQPFPMLTSTSTSGAVVTEFTSGGINNGNHVKHVLAMAAN